ncbi:hypothetical protein BDN72DRAFT_309011 [Pluteus cervinus]|uniref:Uncharacterized protein n=1 Tax=Pluteus cervinus TaxID=181527 RepID=A0ACD3AD62_9AGAR|nr:hypothetical protein BDN72DRAFT_309011 [Pluteus cervinus]
MIFDPTLAPTHRHHHAFTFSLTLVLHTLTSSRLLSRSRPVSLRSHTSIAEPFLQTTHARRRPRDVHCLPRLVSRYLPFVTLRSGTNCHIYMGRVRPLCSEFSQSRFQLALTFSSFVIAIHSRDPPSGQPESQSCLLYRC